MSSDGANHEDPSFQQADGVPSMSCRTSPPELYTGQAIGPDEPSNQLCPLLITFLLGNYSRESVDCQALASDWVHGKNPNKMEGSPFGGQDALVTAGSNFDRVPLHEEQRRARKTRTISVA